MAHSKIFLPGPLLTVLAFACSTGNLAIEEAGSSNPIAISTSAAEDVRGVLAATLAHVGRSPAVEAEVDPRRDILLDPGLGKSLNIPMLSSGREIPSDWLEEFQSAGLIGGIAHDVVPPAGKIRLRFSEVQFDDPDGATVKVSIVGTHAAYYHYSLGRIGGEWTVSDRQLLVSVRCVRSGAPGCP